MKILGIETSCDETAAAVVEDGKTVLSNEIASQIDIHARYGGIVPEVASRQHTLSIIPIVTTAMQKANVGWQDITAVAVTHGPGLAGSLLTGVNVAKAVSFARNLPLIGVNHLEGHMYANWLTGKEPEFPLLCLIVSGGHSDIVLMRGHGSYTLLGRTRDDAAGEAFDKAARLLELGYPGGPAIQKAAEQGKDTLKLPRTWLKGSDDFSFSGIKTLLIRLTQEGKTENKPDAAASFQSAVIDVLVGKTIAAAERHGVKQIIMCGGVAANKVLRNTLVEKSPLPVLIPPMILCTDNAAMIAACGYYRFKAGYVSDLSLDVIPGLKLPVS
ncbi:MAG TPA: tRNA (adenosine(37)-N6)-threonylcarbamoyltransferase complex transferase subunit TsaD [Dehalococcoidales bacterium]|nr:tRNA (adenosine(37)-N6)-threonylcarbamoyltransferase complex transferase subunit TsaD [Dehalococcoidales bacterium]